MDTQAIEKEVLSAIMVKPSLIHDSAEEFNVRQGHFSKESHRILYRSMLELHKKGIPPDLVFLKEHITNNGEWGAMGGAEYLGQLLNRHGTTSNFKHYCTTLVNKSQLRQVYEMASRLASMSLDNDADYESIMLQASDSIGSLLEKKGPDSSRDLGDVVRSETEALRLRAMNPDVVTGVRLGIGSFDNITSGLKPGDLVILGARPAMGKTASGLAGVYNAVRSGKTVLSEDGVSGEKVIAAIFSLEMPAEQLISRTLVRESKTKFGDWKSGRVDPEQWSHIARAADDIISLRDSLFIFDRYTSSVEQIVNNCRNLKRRKGIDLVMIDYLQLVECSKKSSSANERVSHITREFKKMAKELGCVVILLSQLNRALESREDKRPRISDLRDSGSIEQDADLVGLIYRDCVYNDMADPHQAELIIAKHRSGPTGVVHFTFNPETQEVT